MKFETRFNIGDEVWLMKNNKPKKVIISAIQIFYVNTNQDRITYNARDALDSCWLDNTNLQESQLYKTKQEMLSSLLGTPSRCKGSNCRALYGAGHSVECIAEHEKACGAHL